MASSTSQQRLSIANMSHLATHQRPKPPPTPPGVNLLVPLCSAERFSQSQGCSSSCVCPRVLHHVEMKMRGMQVSVDGYTELNNMTLIVHNQIHQWCRKPIKSVTLQSTQ